MKRYYTRACNFYHGNESKKLVAKKKSLPLNGNKEIPKEILLAESVKLASKFGGQDSYKFINAFLDNFVKNDTNENN